MGKTWESPLGNLFFSLVIRGIEKSKWSWIPLSSAVSIAGCLKKSFPGLDVKIKWPNDLYLGEAKLGGVLCEAFSDYVIVGVGLNCVSKPQGLDQPVIDLTTARGGILTVADQLRDPIWHSLLEGYESLSLYGTHFLVSEYEALAALPKGTAIQFGINNKLGIVKCLGQTGELVVLVENEIEKSLFAEEIQKVRLFR